MDPLFGVLDKLANIPKSSIKGCTTAGLEYAWPVSSSLTGFAGANVTTNSKTYSVVGNDPASLLESFVLVDVRAGIETADSRWRAQLWGKNSTDRYYWTNAIGPRVIDINSPGVTYSRH